METGYTPEAIQVGRQYKMPTRFEYEGAGHGFFCGRRGSYNANAAANAWEKVKQLFTDKLA